MDGIPYGRQVIDDDDVDAVVRVLRGDWLTQGPAVEEFEQALAGRVGARFAVAYANGTAALHGACAAAGIGPGNLVVTSPLTFAASANCARYTGASVGFVDVDPETLNLDVGRVPPVAEAVVAVHYAGLPADLRSLARRPVVVIEDACHALGAMTPDGPVGNCANSDLTCFSFHPVKAITTGEGGAVTTNSAELARRLRQFRSHGTVRRPERGGWSYDVESLGYNYRLTDLQAALGTSQLAKLDRFVARRQALADRYRRALHGVDGVVLPPAPDAAAGWSHAYHLFAVRVPAAARRAVYDGLRDRGVGTQVHYRPVHLHTSFAGSGLGPGSFPHAEAAYERLLSLPMHAALTDDQQDHVIEALRDVLGDVAGRAA